MTDNTNENVPEITPLPVPPVGMPKVPITLFNVWTWSTPVIPEFYWNVYSQEQRIKQICKEIGRIEAYLDYISTTANQAHLEIDDHINKVYAELSKKIADLTQRLTTEVARLDALISAETAAREAGDEKLEAEIVKETTDRKAADAKLTADLEKETKDRQDADEGLHGEISTETTARIHADDVLHQEISAEKTAREEADTIATASITQEVADRKAADDALGKRIDAREAEDTKLEAGLATKLERNDLKASGKITITPGEGNTLTIGDSFEADFQALQTAIAGLQASLASETDERRADDSKLWTAVNNRIERGKILAGTGISVVNDPDSSTVTISSTGSADLSEIEAKAEAAKNTADTAATTAGEAKSTAEAAQATATGAESKAEQALTAAQGSLKTVAHTASLAGDGTSSTPLALTPATATTLGGVKVGSGLAVASDGTLSATSQGGGTGIAEVAHDATLKGNGSSSPLGVNYGSGLTVSGGKLTAEVTQAELNAVDGKATSASTAAQEAKNAAQGSLKSVAVGTGLTGNGTAASPLAAKLGLGLESSSQGQIQLKTDTSFYTSSGKLEMAPATATVRGGVKIGAGLKVTNDGTLSTTASAGLTEVKHGATLTGKGTAGSPLEVRTASESEAGVISKNEVKSTADFLTFDAPLSRSYDAISVNAIDSGTSNEEELGVVSKKAIKEIVGTPEVKVDSKYGLDDSNIEGLRVKVQYDTMGFNPSGEISFKKPNTSFTGEKDFDTRDDIYAFPRTGKPIWIKDSGSPTNAPNDCFWLCDAEFWVQEQGSSTWKEAEFGTFEVLVKPNKDSEGNFTGNSFWLRPTPYGIAYYAPEKGAPEGAVYSITHLRVKYAFLPIVADAS